jgi:hypothetical protein
MREHTREMGDDQVLPPTSTLSLSPIIILNKSLLVEIPANPPAND